MLKQISEHTEIIVNDKTYQWYNKQSLIITLLKGNVHPHSFTHYTLSLGLKKNRNCSQRTNAVNYIAQAKRKVPPEKAKGHPR